LGYKDLALPLSVRGIPTVPLKSKTKIAFLPGWETLATTDPAQIEAWDQQYPEANCASVAKAALGEIWFFEFDKPEVPDQVIADSGHALTEIITFKVRSSPGKGHLYFRQTQASLSMGNIGQSGGLDWSARVENQYVVSPGSIHPRTGLPYEIRMDAPIIEAPQWLIDWCIANRPVKKQQPIAADPNAFIQEGGRNVWLTSLAGKDRQNGMEYKEILLHLLRVNEEQCNPPLSDSEVETIAGSVSRYAPGKPDIVLVAGRPAGENPHVPSAVIPSTSPVEMPQLEQPPIIIPSAIYPKFPEWVMKGTSIYEGLVKPFCDVNTRYPEFMFMPAIAILLNYVGTKVRIDSKNLIPSIFMVSIGRAGRVIKSSCVQNAIEYFEYMGCAGYGKLSDSNANGRALVFTPASPEGLGKEMNRLNCRNGIIFYDELSMLTSKAGIENSNLSNALLTMYESGQLSNVVKNPKDSYNLSPGSYCASLIACSTDKNFNANWGKLTGNSTGLNDRFFFLYQPEKLKEIEPYVHVSTQEASVKTLQLIQKAITKASYKIVDNLPLKKFLKENQNSNRAEIRAEKFALYFAIDLGLDEIDETCVERALALVDYELKVKSYIKVYEASTKEGSIQQEIRHQLRNSGGSMFIRDLQRLTHYNREGTFLWMNAFKGMSNSGEISLSGTGVKGDPKTVTLIYISEDDE
jgi:hypothetical protein